MDGTIMRMSAILLGGFHEGCKDMFDKKCKELGTDTLAPRDALDLLENGGVEVEKEIAGEVDFSGFLTLVSGVLKEDFDNGREQATNIFFRCFLLGLQCLKETFKLGDKDGNGYITVPEFQRWMEVCKKEAKEAILELDRDGDGKLSFTEFRDEFLDAFLEDATGY